MTDDRRLDELLAQGLDPEPGDDGFTEKVMTAVRRGNGRLRPLGLRRFTRPAVLAAAAVLIAGGALAAVRTVAPERKEAAPPPASAPVADTLPEQTPAKPVTVLSSDRPSRTGDPTPTPGSFRRGDTEYGYTSQHTAYAKDHSLRLETETYDNDMTVGRPERVTMSLQNITDRPIAIYAPRGCPFAVSAYHRGSREPDTTDPSQAKVWNCAGSNGDPRTMQTQSPEMFVLEPGARRTEEAVVGLTEPGEWYIVGQCICYERKPPSGSPYPTARPTPTPTPTGRPVVEPAIRTSEPERQPPTAEKREPVTSDRCCYDGRELVTPPIRVTASS